MALAFLQDPTPLVFLHSFQKLTKSSSFTYLKKTFFYFTIQKVNSISLTKCAPCNANRFCKENIAITKKDRRIERRPTYKCFNWLQLGDMSYLEKCSKQRSRNTAAQRQDTVMNLLQAINREALKSVRHVQCWSKI